MKFIAGKAGGFTVVELMMGLLVGAIILALAMPVFVEVLQKNRLRAANNELLASLSTARQEAVKRRSTVRICPSSNGTSCLEDGSWESGWVIFTDDDNDGTPDSGEVIRRVTSVHEALDIEADNAVAGYVQFNSAGDALGAWGEIRICHDGSNVNSKAVSVNAAGHVNSLDRDQAGCGTEPGDGDS